MWNINQSVMLSDLTRKMKLVWLLLLVMVSVTLRAQQKKVNIGPTPNWLVPYLPDLTKKPNVKNISDGYYLLLLEEQRQVELKSTYHHFIRMIVSEAGIQNGSEISVDYDPQYEKLVFHKIIIHRDGKEINRLSDASFKLLQQEQDLSRFIYSGTFTAYLILEDVRKGDQIEYAYSVTGANPIFNGKLDSRLYFITYDPIVNYYRNLIISPARQVHFKSFNNAVLPPPKMWNGLTVYEWNNIELRESENTGYVPSWYNSFTRLQVSEYNSWKDVAEWGMKVNTTAPAGPELQRKIAALKRSANGDKAIYLQQALRFVQDDIRYMGIEMGESSHRPNTPDKVLAQRFGDCKDKALLLCTLLHAYDINASMAYVNTDMKGTVSNMLPSPNAFNHVIVCSRFNNKTYWLDATISYQRGTLKDFCEPGYQLALVVTDTTTQLTPIVQTTRGRISVHETFTLPDDEEKDGSLQVVTSYHRDDADGQRAELAATSMKDKEKSYLNYYKKLYGEVTVKEAITTQDTTITNVLQVNESYLIHHLWKKDSSTQKLQFTAIAQSLYDLLSYVSDEQRKVPVTLRYPYDLDYRITINTPIEWSIDQTPLHFKNEYYQFDYTAEKEDHLVTLSYQFKTFSDHIPVKFIPQYVKELKKIIEVTSMELTWKPGLTPVNHPVFQGNWLAIVLALLAAAVFVHLAILYYNYSVLPVRYPLEPLPIAGGLVLLAIGLTFSPMVDVARLCKMEVFNYEIWTTISARKDLGNITIVQLLLISEVLVNVFLLVYAVLLAVLFFNKRDTFPFALATYYFICTVFIYVDNSLYHYYFKTNTLENIISLNSVLWPLLRMAIWVPYLLTSERAKATFIMPHPTLQQ
jgi:transglutaminase-like putative cysteine protease